jgi:hypothetical protein
MYRLAIVLVPAVLAAQAGRWEGALKLPNRELPLIVDLAKNDAGTWVGSFDSPQQNATGIEMSEVKVEGRSVSFRIMGPQAFSGTVSEDGNVLSGTFTAGPNALPLEFKRTGEAKVTVNPKSKAVPAEFAGDWEGTVDVSGQMMRVVLHLANQTDGTVRGTLDSPDQKVMGLALTTISQTGKKLAFTIKVINGAFAGELSDDAITGEWSQNDFKVPLTLRRAAAAK